MNATAETKERTSKDVEKQKIVFEQQKQKENRKTKDRKSCTRLNIETSQNWEWENSQKREILLGN